MKTIVVVVSPEGHTRVQTQGFAGAACRQASRFLERALGRRRSERLTAEFHAPANQSNRRAQESS